MTNEKRKWSMVRYSHNGDLNYQVIEDSRAQELCSKDDRYEILSSSLKQSEALRTAHILSVLTKP